MFVNRLKIIIFRSQPNQHKAKFSTCNEHPGYQEIIFKILGMSKSFLRPMVVKEILDFNV